MGKLRKAKEFDLRPSIWGQEICMYLILPIGFESDTIPELQVGIPTTTKGQQGANRAC